jgi:oligopeptide transport system ATP-binding protein
MAEPILTATDLVKHYPIKGGVLRRTVGNQQSACHFAEEVLNG